MSSTEKVAGATERLHQRAAQLADIDAKRRDITATLGDLERHFAAAVSDARDTTGLASQRRGLLDDLADLDRASAAVQLLVDAAEAEIAEQEARRRLSELRERLPVATEAARQRVTERAAALEAVLDRVAGAAREIVELAGADEADRREIVTLRALEHEIAGRFGEVGQFPPVMIGQTMFAGQVTGGTPRWDSGLDDLLGQHGGGRDLVRKGLLAAAVSGNVGAVWARINDLTTRKIGQR